jgi:CBS domain-containing protein
MNVSTILKNKGSDVITRSPDTTLNEITHILNEHKIGSVVILDVENRVCGIVSERDIVTAIAKKGGAVLEQPVTVCMTKTVFTCSQEDTLEKLMTEMTAHRFRHLPVVEGGRLVGLVSIGDVVKQRIAEAEMEAAAMRDYITTG